MKKSVLIGIIVGAMVLISVVIGAVFNVPVNNNGSTTTTISTTTRPTTTTTTTTRPTTTTITTTRPTTTTTTTRPTTTTTTTTRPTTTTTTTRPTTTTTIKTTTTTSSAIDAMSSAISDAEAFAVEFESEYPDDYLTPNYLNEHLQYVLGYSETVANYAVENADINWTNHADKYAQIYLTYIEEFGRPATWWRASDIEDMLLGDGFSCEVVETIMSAVDWDLQSQKYVKHLSDFYDTFNRFDARYYLEDIVANDDGIDYLLENSGVEWEKHALNMANELWAEYIVQEYYKDQPIAYIQADIVEELSTIWEYTDAEIDYAIENMTIFGISYDNSQYLEYTLNSDNQTYTVTGIGCFDGEYLNIPSTYEGKKVTAIGDNAFKDCTSIINVTIPNTVTSIGDYAFCFCTSLTDIDIPDSVESIGYEALYGCSSLKYNTSDNALYVGNANNPYLVLMKAKNGSITSCEISDTTKFIYNKNFNSVGWYAEVQAFAYCTRLTEIIIPDSVKSIGPIAFYGCTSLTSVKIGNSVTHIGDTAFRGCTSLANLTIGNSVTSIGRNAFADCTSLTSITIPNSVTSIGGFAFYGCTSLANITIPNRVTSVGDYTFYKCASLRSITIPDSVTSIGKYAFYGCASLTNIHFEGTIDQWNAISKGNSWNAQTGNYTIYCTNGTITKGGTVTYYNTANPPSDDVQMVWIPSSGSKYHSTSSCSSMTNPQYVPLEDAKEMGYTACKKCYSN